jgi:hypothetical protein
MDPETAREGPATRSLFGERSIAVSHADPISGERRKRMNSPSGRVSLHTTKTFGPEAAREG